MDDSKMHLNRSGDCLPTLIDDSYLGAYAVAWKRKERERAAGMCKEEAVRWRSHTTSAVFDSLAARIRKGD